MPVPHPILVGDYVLCPPNQGTRSDSSHTGMVVGVVRGHPIPLIVSIDSSRRNLAFSEREVTAIRYEVFHPPVSPVNVRDGLFDVHFPNDYEMGHG